MLCFAQELICPTAQVYDLRGLWHAAAQHFFSSAALQPLAVGKQLFNLVADFVDFVVHDLACSQGPLLQASLLGC